MSNKAICDGKSVAQGDPLSPFLFNLVVEGLSSLLTKARHLDLVKGVMFGPNNIHITHLQFTNDTILFIGPRMKYLLNAKRIMRCFELALGSEG
ncbi:hypothetical protein Ddye_000741 [Dipteronia dyeriana]|uniref:Reverse transcriptase domain-containing protein n=1 Tax=Dipteronia dyeriana TaxID=168575 RepID=A0AAD9XMN9_9ROSI|nr:hypothetical protein Ddye_000741 [Dipteronia dyeriana]